MRKTVDLDAIALADRWKPVFIHGFAPAMTLAALKALRTGLQTDDRQLCQGATTVPAQVMACNKDPVEAACAVGYGGWKSDDLQTVEDVSEYFARMCFEADQRLVEAAACRWFLNWFDDTPRPEVIRLLVPILDDLINDRECDDAQSQEAGLCLLSI